jgi:hypothetical protein
MAPIGAQFKPGDAVPHSGIYRVTHDPIHAQEHEVTCLFGKHFPPCRGCGEPRFVLVRAGRYVETQDHFKCA